MCVCEERIQQMEEELLSPRIVAAVTSESRPASSQAFKCGTLPECLNWLLTRVDDSALVQEASSFLFGYRAFTTSAELVRHVGQLARTAAPPERLWPFVRLWSKLLFPDHDRVVLQLLLELPGLPVSLGNEIKLMLLRKVKKSTVSSGEGGAAEGFGNLMPSEWSAAVVAQQLTLIESELFYAIQFEEFLEYAAGGENRAVGAAPNLTRVAARFNAVSYWTASQVLIRGADSLRSRAAELERFVGIMEELRQLNNFNGLMAVMAGLNNAAIVRLKDEWAQVSSEKRASFVAMEKLMDPSRNFKNYREELARVARDASKALLPYVAVHLRDVLFIELGNPRGEAVVNYEKTLLFGNALSKLCYFQRHHFHLPRHPELHRYLLQLDFLDEEQLHARSLEYRPLAVETAEAPEATVASPRKQPRSSEEPLTLGKSPRGVKSLMGSRSTERSYDDLQKQVNPLFGQDAKVHDMKRVPSVQSMDLHDRPTACLPDTAATPLAAAVEVPSSPRSVITKQSMARDGQFLVIPTSEAESQAFARHTNEVGLNWLAEACAKRNIIMPASHYLRFFVVDHCNEKKALKHIVDYWTYYDSIGFKNIITTDVSAALLSHLIAPPLSPDWCDMEGRPLVIMRANLWFDGDPSQPSLEDLQKLLMWIGEGLARNTLYHYVGFTFVMDMKDWTKRNFSTPVYTQIMHMIQNCLPVRCERFIFLDVPKVFGASWKLVSATLKPDFKKIMVISTREDMLERLIDRQCLPPDLGGTVAAPDMSTYIRQKKTEEQQAILPPTKDKKPELSPIVEVFSDEPDSRSGVYELRIRGRASSLSSPSVTADQPKTFTSKNSSRLSFFKKKRE